MLSVFVFNLAGYKCWFLIREGQTVLSKSAGQPVYNDNELTVVKIPLSLPYSTNWSSFECYNGSVEIAGRHYEYVKRKVVNDTLILLCLPNAAKDKLVAAKNSFEKLVSGQSDTNNKQSTTVPDILKLLNTVCSYEHHFNLTFPVLEAPQYAALNSSAVLRGATTATWQPPDGLI